MTEILCTECNELNDLNAVKCESCKASLLDANCSEVDECENDYRFIEEAELKGEVYKLENVDDGQIVLEIALPVVDEKYEIKTESFENSIDITENDGVDNETYSNINNDEVRNIKTKQIAKPFNIEHSEIGIPVVPYQCNQCSKSFKRKATLKAHANKDHAQNERNIGFESLASDNKSKSKRSISPTFSDCCDSEYVPSDEEDQCNNRRKKSKSTPKTKRELDQITDESDSENNNIRKKPSTKCKINSSQTLLHLKQNKPDLKRHMVYKCTACEKITTNYEDHIKHIVIHEAPVDSLTETTSLDKLKKTPSGFLKCEECEIVFMSQRDYTIHERMNHGGEVYQCDICKAYLFNRSSLRKHKLRHKRKPAKKNTQFECIVCNQKFVSQFLMLHHRRTHTDVMKKIEEMTIMDKDGKKTIYVCKICAKTSKNKYRHEEHLRVHTKEKPYKCEQCGTKISTANALAHHLRLHENDRPFKCDVCDATYRHKKSLKKHLRVHTGEKPFQCRYCDRSFPFNYTRASHERNCHLSDGKTRKRRTNLTHGKRASETEVPRDTTVKLGIIETRSCKKLDVI